MRQSPGVDLRRSRRQRTAVEIAAKTKGIQSGMTTWTAFPHSRLISGKYVSGRYRRAAAKSKRHPIPRNGKGWKWARAYSGRWLGW